MIFKNLADEITEQLVRDFAQANRTAQIEYFDRNYRELEGNVFDKATDLQTYWPRRYQEGDEAYNERVKIWTQVPKIVTQRVVSMLLQGETKREWVPVSDADQGEADRANELDSLTNEANDWDFRANQVYYYALGIGEYALWPEFRRYDRLTGEPYTCAGGQGIPLFAGWFPWFVEPITFQEYADEIAGAAKIIFLDNQQATPLLGQSIGKNSELITQVYLSPIHNRMSGDIVSKGFYRAWSNNLPVPQYNENGAEDEAWWIENKYGCNPVVFFRSPDPDETSYRGKSYCDRFRKLSVEHSRALSSIGQAIDVLPNIWEYTGDQTKIKELVIRANSIVQIPMEGKLQQAGRALDLSEDWKLVNYLEKTIALVGAIPAEVWDTLGSAGKVESGVALKLVLQPIAESVQITRQAFASAEKQKMRVTVRMFNAYNKNQIDLSKIRPSVTYDENIIPVDEAKEVLNDILLLDKGVKKLTDLVRKYNPQVKTEQEAEAFIAKTAESKAQREPQAPAIRFRDRNAGQATQ